ncbi:XRE family transcriptional regulator [Aliigemmobacter aestuarii]|uniref:XRE family transcriptional regulator n=1 Tax=Aliigemmobacter aestuarii TaxID=1445661 RepID=A0A4S3ML00_9RHOB|nr:XRE family transcriptional regulator [Gemmobacter aestuarii]THD82878.1 XRE family transcriptional regulator [Gemmobacter aestuarii]
MPKTSLTGTRVRERRLQAGMRQADVARGAGISAAYLNLIEHNRRRVGEDVLARLAQVLGVSGDALREGAEAPLQADLRAAAGAAADAGPEVDRIEDFTSRFPGWAGLTAQLFRRTGQLERAVAALNDRLTHDPHLNQALHELLSAVSSVRSTAAILAETDDIDPDWRRRFHDNLHADSERLAEGAEVLVAYLDGSGDEAEAAIATPQEEVDAWLDGRGWALPELDGPEGAEALRPEIEALASGAARALARDRVARAEADAAALPLAPFRAALAEEGMEPARLAARFGVPILAVFRRIAGLSDLRAGLVICDASGALVYRKPAEGFAPPRFGTGCALWPLYGALGRPMAPVESRIEMAGRGGRRYLARAFCQPSYPAGFGGPELREAAMLLLPDPSPPGSQDAVLRVGTTCRICPISDCAARREPSILGEART